MPDAFFSRPILNSPYEYPTRHWELDDSGQPTQTIIEHRRPARFVTPIPKPRRRRATNVNPQATLGLEEAPGLNTAERSYELTSSLINDVRLRVDQWRAIEDPSQWRVTPETAR